MLKPNGSMVIAPEPAHLNAVTGTLSTIAVVMLIVIVIFAVTHSSNMFDDFYIEQFGEDNSPFFPGSKDDEKKESDNIDNNEVKEEPDAVDSLGYHGRIR